MNAKSPVYTELAECQDCYKCIRKCPVKSIRVEKGHASIIPEGCIFCGRCVVNCPSYAKQYRKDVEKVKLLLAGGRKVIASLAPSFVSEFAPWTAGELIAALKRLGFYAVSETALGADFLSARIARDLEQTENLTGAPADSRETLSGFNDNLNAACPPINPSQTENLTGAGRVLISSACPAIVEYIKLYEPRLAPYISPHASPLVTHARFLHARYGGETGDGAAVVFIGPCIAKKREADLYGGEINAAITFGELREWLQKEQISPEKLAAGEDDVFEPRRSAGGAFFPVEGGEIAAFSAYMSRAVSGAAAGAGAGSRIRTVSASGIEAVQEALAGFDPAAAETPLFLELLACAGGCVNGPGMTCKAPGISRNLRVQDYGRTADRVLDRESLAASPPVDAAYPASPPPRAVHTEGEIAGALATVGKFTPADRLNCASCGYDTCRDFALALLDGHAEKSMCASYMRKLANKTANGLLRTIPNGIVIVDKNLTVIECNEQFAALMGPETEELFKLKPGLEGADLTKISPFAPQFQSVMESEGPDHIQSDVREGKKIYHLTVFAVEKGLTAAGVAEDITAPRVRIDKTVERAREIIKKNVSTVQQIAFLLGENAAESEAILNSIIESYTVGEEDV